MEASVKLEPNLPGMWKVIVWVSQIKAKGGEIACRIKEQIFPWS